MNSKHHTLIISIIFVLIFGFLSHIPIVSAQDPATPVTTHVVQQGENLYRIALHYGFSPNEIAAINGIVNYNQVYIGQVLVLPLPIGANVPVGGDTIDPPDVVCQPAEITQTDPVPPAVVTHIVQANEGLGGIATQYGVSWTDIASANGISNPNLIYPGQELTIPSPSLVPPADYGQPAPAVLADRYILVELSQQKITAYENGVPVREVIVSTGLPGTPTVLGDYAVYSKIPAQTMSGPGYYLPDVPWVMYFYQGYAIHGTYWHNNFGSPMSHGCVNLPSSEALWFYEFAQIGTPVRVIQ